MNLFVDSDADGDGDGGRYTPNTKLQLIQAIDDYPSNKKTYGPINNWNVSKITDMSELFKNKAEFNEDI